MNQSIILYHVFFRKNTNHPYYFDIVIETNIGFASLSFGGIYPTVKPGDDWNIFEPIESWIRSRHSPPEVIEVHTSHDGCYYILLDDNYTLFTELEIKSAELPSVLVLGFSPAKDLAPDFLEFFENSIPLDDVVKSMEA